MGQRWGRRMRIRPALASGAAALAVLVSGCGAGQLAQTSNQVTATGGVEGRSGSILVRDAQFVWDGPVPGDAVYQPGDDARLQLTIINDADPAIVDGSAADRLIAVSSPIATSGRITGDTWLPDRGVLTAGYDEPVASILVPGARAVEITLVDLTSPVRAGLVHPVVLTFERAGDLRLELPVENPDLLPPRAHDEDRLAESAVPGAPR